MYSSKRRNAFVIKHIQPKRCALLKFIGIAVYLDLAIGLQELSDGNLVLLQSPLDKFGAADIDSSVHVRSIVFREGAAVNDKQATGPTLQKPCQALNVHGTTTALLPCHEGAAPDRAHSPEEDHTTGAH